jgi:hypothetical protein
MSAKKVKKRQNCQPQKNKNKNLVSYEWTFDHEVLEFAGENER